jgi:rhamnulokinase
MAGTVGPGVLAVRELHRWANAPVSAGGTLHTDVLALYAGVLGGLRLAGRAGGVAAVGIDGWGVDYGLLDSDGALIGNPVHYRDARTDGALGRLTALVPAAELYQATGIPALPFNTSTQLVAAGGSAALRAARTLLLLPDLLGYWLTGAKAAEVTNASTTGLLDVSSRRWHSAVIRRLGIPARLFPPLLEPGELAGGLRPGPAAAAGLPEGLPVLTVGSHDTASAVAATPAVAGDFAFISSGTWSLAGLELDGPVLSEESRQAGFTNEAGLDGTVRYLRNVTGLWLLQESVRAWAAAGDPAASLPALLAAAALEEPLRFVIDVDAPEFAAPGDMPGRIAAACRAAGQGEPRSRPQLARCVLDSLALGHGRAVAQAQRLSGRHADVVHLVGGGSRIPLLCQLTADACGLPVVAGPAEATAIGNILAQGRALGAVPGDLAGMRALVRGTQRLRRYRPRARPGAGDRAWRAARERAGRPPGGI